VENRLLRPVAVSIVALWSLTMRHFMSRKSSHRSIMPGIPRKSLYQRRRPLFEQLEQRQLLAIVTVTTAQDDITPNDGSVSLREAITAVNAGNDLGDPDITAQSPGTFGVNDTINFNISGSGVHAIKVGTDVSAAGIPLPTIVNPVTINGYSQTGASANTLANSDNAVILIQLDGGAAGTAVNGLVLGPGSDGSTIRGLAISRFQADSSLNGGVGILLESNGNTIVGNFVGTDAFGTSRQANGGDGIRIVDASNNVIGGASPADRNLVSANALDGIHIEGTFTTPATGNLVEGNFVGTDLSGVSRFLAQGLLPASITVGADGNLWFTEFNNNAIGRITPAGVITEFSLAGLQANSDPFDIVSDPTNNLLYFTERSTGRIGRINPLAGSDAAIVASEIESAVVPSGSGAFLSGITLGSDGNLWFTEAFANRVANISPDLTTINEFSSGITAGATPGDIVSGADGALWFTEVGNNAIGRITTAGVVTEFSLAGLQANSAPIGIVSDPANNLLYFTEFGPGRIGRINPLAGSDASILASEQQSAVVPSGAPAEISNITFGPDGNLWFTEGEDRVGKVNPNLTTINEFAAGISVGASPEDIVAGPDGALWFTEAGNDAIGRITTTGNVSQFPLPGAVLPGNNFFGIEISGGTNNTIGGTVAGARNVVGFNRDGIELDNGSQQNIVQGNFVGVGADGVTVAGNSLHGIALRSSNGFGPPLGPAQPNEPGVSFNLIGGTAAGSGNLVEFNGTGGVAVFGNPVSASGQPNIGNAIEGNSIFENGRDYLSASSAPTPLIGIDLTNQFVFPRDDGVTPNDSKGHGAPNDPNNFQNFPVLTSVQVQGGSTTIAGTLHSAPLSTYRIEFFANDPDPLGLPAEGQQFLGFVNATTNASGDASFTTTFNVAIDSSRPITATATDAIGNTSEFSAGPPVAQGLPGCDITTLNVPGNVGSAALQEDADNPGQNVLLVTGSNRSDVIVIEPRPSNPSQLRVKINGHLIGFFASTDVQRIVAFGLNGNDTIVVNGTLTQSATLFGGNGNDFLYGGAGDDQLEGDAGNDHLFGGGGDDELCGDDGNDFLFGGLGNDTLFGETGKDQLFGEAGNDVLLGGDNNDFLFGGTGNDQLFGQAGNDQLFGENGNDIIVGGDGNDKLFGGNGRDLLIGGDGSDQLFGETGDDILVSGSTANDENQEALAAIEAEWTSSNNYATRVSNITSGGGANGSFTLDDTTVIDDGLVDLLYGGGGSDWFRIGTGDKVKDKTSGEIVT
jgi:streptogramin lyase